MLDGLKNNFKTNNLFDLLKIKTKIDPFLGEWVEISPLCRWGLLNDLGLSSIVIGDLKLAHKSEGHAIDSVTFLFRKDDIDI